MPENAVLNMRMISEDSLLTTRRVLASQSVGTVTRVVQVGSAIV